MLGLPSTTLLVGKYEVGEPRLLGHGRYGPVIRARDMHSRELVAVKVFNAAEAFHSGRLAGCSSLAEAEAEAIAQFSHEVQLLQGSLLRGVPKKMCRSRVVSLGHLVPVPGFE